MSRNHLGISLVLFVLGSIAEIIGYYFMDLNIMGGDALRIVGVLFFIPGFLLLLLFYAQQKEKRTKEKESNEIEDWEKNKMDDKNKF